HNFMIVGWPHPYPGTPRGRVGSKTAHDRRDPTSTTRFSTLRIRARTAELTVWPRSRSTGSYRDLAHGARLPQPATAIQPATPVSQSDRSVTNDDRSRSAAVVLGRCGGAGHGHVV